MITKYILFSIFFISVDCPAQQPERIIDSLENILKKNPNADSVKVNLLIMKGNAIMSSDLQQGMKFTDEALVLAQKIKWNRGIASAYRQKGVIYQQSGDFPNAVEFAQLALKAAESLNSKRFNAGIYNNIGIIQLQMGEYDKALVNLQQLLSISRELKLPMEESLALLNMGTAYLRKIEIDSAQDHLSKCLAIAEPNGFWQIAGYALANMGAVYNRRLADDTAIEYFKKSILYGEKTKDINIKVQALSGMSETYINTQQHNKAEVYAQEALDIAIQTGQVQYQKENYMMLSDIYKEQGKYEKSLAAYKNFITMRDSMVNEENKSEIVKKEIQFAQDKKDAVVKAEHAAEIKRQTTIRNFLIAGAALVILASGFLFISYKRRRDAIAKKNDAELKAQITDTELKVMRLQMNPHFIFNSLNSIGDYIAKNNPKEADDYLSKFAKVMRMTLENSEQQAIPLSDDLKALDLYMQLEAKRLNNKFTYEIKVSDDIDKENTLVPPMIFQPFAENSIWHGIAKKEGQGHIIIDIKKEGEMLSCRIDDDGIGRKQAESVQTKPEDKKQSLGMKITKARIEILNKLKGSNATVQLVDKPQGVTAELKLPLETNF